MFFAYFGFFGKTKEQELLCISYIIDAPVIFILMKSSIKGQSNVNLMYNVG